MHDDGYRRGVIEGGIAAQECLKAVTAEKQALLDALAREIYALGRLTKLRVEGATGVSDTQGFLRGFRDGWSTVMRDAQSRFTCSVRPGVVRSLYHTETEAPTGQSREEPRRCS